MPEHSAGESGDTLDGWEAGEVRGDRGAWDTQDAIESLDGRDAWEARGDRETRDAQENRGARDTRDALESLDGREIRGARDTRDALESLDGRDAWEARGDRETQEIREAQEIRGARDIWATVLDRLEEAVETAARTMDDPLAAPRIELWSPPQEPLPAELAPRAERLIEAQKALLERMESRRREAGKQMGALRRVPGVGTAGPSLYLDVSG